MTETDIATTLEQTPPVALEEVADAGAEPPEDWDAAAHDDEDVLEGVEISDAEPEVVA